MLGYFPSSSFLTGGSATTLADLRAKLNDDIGVIVDRDTSPWTVAQRNQAISDGYAQLWRSGVWKDAKQDITTVTDTWAYALTSIRHAYRIELLDSAFRVLELPKGMIESDGAGAGTYQIRLVRPLASGNTLRVIGYAPYKSVFADDADTDDLPAEYNRIPLLKAKSILYTQQLAKFIRYGEAQSIRPAMNVSADVMLGLISAAEREFAAETRDLSGQRPRVGLTSRL